MLTKTDTARSLLDAVRGCFTDDGGLPDNLLPRIDAVLDAPKPEHVAYRVSYNWGETWTVFQHDPSLQLAGVPGVVIRPLVEGETE